MTLHSAVLFVSNIEISKRFYVDYLDQKIEHDFGANIIFQGGLSLWQVFKSHEIAEKLPTNGVSNRFELYFEHDHLSEIFEKLEKQGVRFFHGLKEESWGQLTFRFFDPDSHLIEIGEKMESFVNRMYNSGLSIKQISQKSGISSETLEKMIQHT